MDIAQRDQIINALRFEIKRVQGGILNQLQDIGEIQKENEFLRGVAEDYKKYHRAINPEKHFIISVNLFGNGFSSSGRQILPVLPVTLESSGSSRSSICSIE